MQSSRIVYFDILKAIAIITVIYTHCLQHLGIGGYLHHPIFKFFYAFHMPLFMTISGYFAVRTLKQPFAKIMKDKVKRLLLPCLTCGLLVIEVNYVTEMGTYSHTGFRELISNLWYLKSLFLCFLFARVALLITHRTLNAAIISITASLIFPYAYHLNFMLPFFWLGYAWHENEKWCHYHNRKIFLVSCLLFFFLGNFWDGGDTTYISPLKLYSISKLQWLGTIHLKSYLLRIGIGIVGTLLVTSFVWELKERGIRRTAISRIGQHTLEIYILQAILINTSVLTLFKTKYISLLYEILYCPTIAFVIIVGCLLLLRLFRKNPLLYFLLFGKKR